MNKKREIYFVIGPTSSGKTALGVQLANELQARGAAEGRPQKCEIVCCDSRQVYKELDLGSGKATPEEMQGIPHHLLNVATPGETFTVVDYTKLALQAIEEIYSRGNIPIVSGGTGFYIDSLLYEYNLPDVPINKGLRKKLEPLPTKVLFAYFAKLDTKFVDKLKRSKKPNKLKEFQNNKNRIIRYIEIAEKLGSVPELKKVKRFKKNKYNLHIIKTSVERKDLQERIYKRTQERLEAGMLQELQSIIGKYKLKEKYVRAWGYEFSLMWDLLHKKINHKFFLDTFVLKEYQYARRQDTWFRRYKNHL